MNNYTPNAQVAQALLQDVLSLDPSLKEIPLFANMDTELSAQILDEAGKFISSRISTLNRSGDEEGCSFQEGAVTTPKGFRQAYQAFYQGGWAALSAAPDDGGQGLPLVLEFMLYEWLSGANHAWTMAPGLLHGAYEAIKNHASSELKDQYLSKIATGEWLATMCITESHAGSDLGMLQTKARIDQTNHSYRLSGTKIFISGGEHDLSDNIVHLVLARLPNAPLGTKGLSLFLVPKFTPDGHRSRVFCERIEDKMGIHASPTCVIRFDEAQGWLIGQENKGLNAMFLMMNAARLHVALQGIGLLDASLQKSIAYANERKQFKAIKPNPLSITDQNSGPSVIAEHPQIQKTLDKQAALIYCFRLLSYKTAIALDIAKHHPEESKRDRALQWANWVTPILKASCTQFAFDGISECLQVFGGHGYVREWGIEQHLRDCRIAMIYEGTNEIQAIDLMTRKTLPDEGRTCQTILQELLEALEDTPHLSSVRNLFEKIKSITELCVNLNAQSGGIYHLHWIMPEYLKLMTIGLLAWSAAVAKDHDSLTRQGLWLTFVRWIQPEFDQHYTTITEYLNDAM
jgi:alkylation response protein AidB-like acyl-CoA dehydrogenase